MTYDMQAVREDIAFMKAMAQEGRRAPLLTGRYLLGAGIIYAGASVAAWAIATRLLAVSPWWLAGVWVIAGAIYMPFVLVWNRQVRSKPGASAVSNRATAVIWRALGAFSAAVFLAAIAAAWRLHSGLVFAIFPALILAFYGAAWLLSAHLSGLKWLRLVAGGCFLAAAVSGLLIDQVDLYLLFAAALLLLVALPGWLLMRGEPSEIV